MGQRAEPKKTGMQSKLDLSVFHARGNQDFGFRTPDH
jgi:hypothetical protein